MQFHEYSFLPTFSKSIANVRFMLKSIDPYIIEKSFQKSKKSKESDCDNSESILFIGNNQDVISNFDSSHYIVSENFITDVYNSKLNRFPLETCRQRNSLCLYTYKIVLSGMNPSEFEFYHKHISILGGDVVKTVTQDVKFVISNTALSEKVFEAKNLNIPIVSTSWLDKVIKSFKLPDISQHLLPRFTGCTFSSTDLLPSAVTKLKKIITSNGGEYTDTFDASKTTYLISSHLVNTKKISLALSNSIPIVHPDWISKDTAPFEFILNWWCLGNYQRNIKLFEGMIFAIEKKCENAQAIQDCIYAHGGQFGKNATHIVVTNGFNRIINNVIQVTEMWIWACAERRRLVDLTDSVIYRPLKHTTPFKSVSGITFYLFDFDNDELRTNLANMIRLCGGIVFYRNHKSVNYIISNKSIPNNPYNVPVVAKQFVYQMIMHCELPDCSLFRIHTNNDSQKSISNAILNEIKMKATKIKETKQTNEFVLTDTFLDKLEVFSPEPVSSPIAHENDDNVGVVTYGESPPKLMQDQRQSGEDPILKLIRGSDSLPNSVFV